MLCVYWVIANKHLLFIRGQEQHLKDIQLQQEQESLSSHVPSCFFSNNNEAEKDEKRKDPSSPSNSSSFSGVSNGSGQDRVLSKQKWESLQQWRKHVVKLDSVELIDTMLVYLAIHNLGKKIHHWRKEFVPS